MERAKRPTRRSLKLGAGLLCLAACSTSALASGHGKPAAGGGQSFKKNPVVVHDDAPAVSTPEAKHEIESYAKLAQQAADLNKWALADHFLQLIVDLPAAEVDKKAPYLALADRYEKERMHSKAIAIYEKMLVGFPQDPDVPQTLLKLGLIYRQTGARKLAIARFYSVLNSALKVDGEKVESYRALTRQAQWEIAETYFLNGEYEQAQKFCNLLLRLELTPEERARASFRLTYCSYLLGNMPAAIQAARQFLQEFPADAQSPECRYLLATALRSQKQAKEAFDTVLELLRAEKSRAASDPERWRFWQKKTGNEFANEYYQAGDFMNALTIYQTLAKLSDAPEWQWPVIYQMGLCFERLRLTERAAEAYKYLLDEAGKPGREPEKLPESVRGLPEMAKWRGQQLAWSTDTTTRLERLLGQVPSPLSKP
jgi:tetratricopeptide (TPR) repeat protein